MTPTPQAELREEIYNITHRYALEAVLKDGYISWSKLDDEIANLLLSKRQEWVEATILYTLNTIYEDLNHMIRTHDGFNKLVEGALAHLKEHHD